MSSGPSGKDEEFIEYFRDELPNPTFVPDEMREQAQASEDGYYAQQGAEGEAEQGEGGEGWYSVPLEGAIYQPPEIAKGPPEEAPQHVARLGGGGGGGGGGGSGSGGDYYGADAQAPAYGQGSGSAPMSGAGGGRNSGGRRGRPGGQAQGGGDGSGAGAGSSGGHAPSFSSPSELAQTLGMSPGPDQSENWDPLMPQRHAHNDDHFAGAQGSGEEDWGSAMPSSSFPPSSLPSSSAQQNSSFPFPPARAEGAERAEHAPATDPFSASAASAHEYANESFGAGGFNPSTYAQEAPFGEEENNLMPRLPPLAPAALAPDSIPEDPFMPRAAAPSIQEQVPFTRSADDVPTMRPSFGISLGASIPGLGGNSYGGLLGSGGLPQITPKKKKRAKKVF